MNPHEIRYILSGIFATTAVYTFGVWLYKRTKLTLLNPILTSIVLILCGLVVFNISLENYQKGGQYIAFFLKPVTVMLAIPMYRQHAALKKHFSPILTGVLISVIISFSSITLLASLFHLDATLKLSLYPKSITTPMGFELTKMLGGLPAITIFAIVVTGITGALSASWVLTKLKIKSPVARGIAIGSSSHALGTTKAFELGETEGAMSSLAIALTGLTTVLLVPFFLRFL